MKKLSPLVEGEDFYWEGAAMVFTAWFHLKRGHCCGSGCRHCPYEPRWTKDTTQRAPRQQEVEGSNEEN